MAKSRAAPAATKVLDNPDDIRMLREQLAAMNARLAETARVAESATAELALFKQTTGGVMFLPPEEVPAYELTQPWYSPDDVYYPAGTMVEDITGQITPNEHMIPLNAAAEDRMVAYLQKLPAQGTPNFDHIIQAAMEMRPREGDDPRIAAEYHGRVLQRAMELKYKAEGRLAREPGDRPRVPVKLPTKPGQVPIMPNTRIRQVVAEDRYGHDYRGRFMPGARENTRPASTRMRAPAPSAAERIAPVLGTVASQPLGNVGPGVQAA